MATGNSFARFFVLLTLVAVFLPCSLSSHACYDHQTVDYKSQFEPVECGAQCSVTPFFSPDHSIGVYVDLIKSARESIDIFTPGFDSWSKCTHYSKECDADCIGCSIENQRNESFPVFPALLNAVHQYPGLKVRIVTNNYTQPTCEGMISPLDWLYLNKIDIRFYQTTTFMHSKFMIIDKGKRTMVSSVNWSYTSFMKNREAGVILDDCDCKTIDFYQSVFDSDWNSGMAYTLRNDYTKEQLNMITSTEDYNVDIPPPPQVPGGYITPLNTYTDVTVVRGYTSPDNALDTVLSSLKNVKSSMQLAIYQITDKGLCDTVLSLFQNKVNISIIVSARIVSYYDWKSAQACYTQLYNNGMQGRIRKALTKYTFAHEKYWIIDDDEVHLSTGNWSPSDFPSGSTFSPSRTTGAGSVNRDLLVVMNGSSVVKAFQTVFQKDWDSGTEWMPKN